MVWNADEEKFLIINDEKYVANEGEDIASVVKRAMVDDEISTAYVYKGNDEVNAEDIDWGDTLKMIKEAVPKR